jgi:hypothetical protein
MAEVDVSIRLRGCADAEHHNIRCSQRLFIERTGLQPSRGHILLNQAGQPDLEKRRLRPPNGLDFVHVAVDPEDVVPNLSKAGGAHAADIAQANDDYILLGNGVLQPDLAR